MANRITLLRIVLLFVAIGFIYTYTVLGELIAFGVVLVVFVLDGLDGVIARREGRADETGAVMDIFGDRVVENALWIVFAHIGLIPVWVPITVMVRGMATDAVRSIARTRGETAFGTMLRSPIGRWLVASRASRAVYATSKVVTFGFLLLYVALIQAQVRGMDLGEMERGLPWAYRVGMGLVYFTVAFCLIRGLPVLIEGRRHVRSEPN
jgi:CDP-diacylglycerol--glycerol-3-phosphate 3-phosphatidyltransferase